MLELASEPRRLLSKQNGGWDDERQLNREIKFLFINIIYLQPSAFAGKTRPNEALKDFTFTQDNNGEHHCFHKHHLTHQNISQLI